MDLHSADIQIDAIDNQLLDLFIKRMETVGRIADYNKNNGLPVIDRKREERVIARMTRNAGVFMADYALDFFEALMVISRRMQEDIINGETTAEQ